MVTVNGCGLKTTIMAAKNKNCNLTIWPDGVCICTSICDSHWISSCGKTSRHKNHKLPRGQCYHIFPTTGMYTFSKSTWTLFSKDGTNGHFLVSGSWTTKLTFVLYCDPFLSPLLCRWWFAVHALCRQWECSASRGPSYAFLCVNVTQVFEVAGNEE